MYENNEFIEIFLKEEFHLVDNIVLHLLLTIANSNKADA